MYQIVKLNFPFADNVDKGKPRPALVVTPSFGKHNQLIVAYITSNLEDILETDVLIDTKEKDFHLTGLRSTSLIKLHRLITVTPSQLGIVGNLPKLCVPEIKEKLLKIFQLKLITLLDNNTVNYKLFEHRAALTYEDLEQVPTVIAASIVFLNEKNNLLRKTVAATLVMLGVVLLS